MQSRGAPQILIIDLGSQYTQVIRRSLRYLGFHSIILPPQESLAWAKENNPKGIILSGGSASVYDADAPQIPMEILSLGVPVLGVCYGMQWLAYLNDKSAVHKEKGGKSYGPVEVTFSEPRSNIFQPSRSGSFHPYSLSFRIFPINHLKCTCH